MVGRDAKCNILWSEKKQKKSWKNDKKGVDNGGKVWYINGALKRGKGFRGRKK